MNECDLCKLYLKASKASEQSGVSEPLGDQYDFSWIIHLQSASSVSKNLNRLSQYFLWFIASMCWDRWGLWCLLKLLWMSDKSNHEGKKRLERDMWVSVNRMPQCGCTEGSYESDFDNESRGSFPLILLADNSHRLWETKPGQCSFCLSNFRPSE